MVYGNASPLFNWNRDVEQFELGLDIAGLVVDDLTQSSTRRYRCLSLRCPLIVAHFYTLQYRAAFHDHRDFVETAAKFCFTKQTPVSCSCRSSHLRIDSPG